MIEVSYPGRRTARSALRRVAVVGCLALTLAFLPVTPASAQRTIDQACPPTDVVFVDPGFPDQVALSPANEREIICVYNWGITRGRADGTFGTLAGLSRAQLATFVIGLLSAPAVETAPGAAPADTFTDTDAIPAEHRNNVLIAANLGIAVGFQDGSFRPNATVTRAQAASYLVRTQRVINGSYGAITPESFQAYIDTLDYDPELTDIAGNAHEDNIVLLARLGVVGGYPDGTYRPGAGLMRGHMAALLARHLDVLHDLDLDYLAPPSYYLPGRPIAGAR
jgi:hypothetical protein